MSDAPKTTKAEKRERLKSHSFGCAAGLIVGALGTDLFGKPWVFTFLAGIFLIISQMPAQDVPNAK
jgi:hypothetical protein